MADADQRRIVAASVTCLAAPADDRHPAACGGRTLIDHVPCLALPGDLSTAPPSLPSPCPTRRSISSQNWAAGPKGELRACRRYDGSRPQRARDGYHHVYVASTQARACTPRPRDATFLDAALRTPQAPSSRFRSARSPASCEYTRSIGRRRRARRRRGEQRRLSAMVFVRPTSPCRGARGSAGCSMTPRSTT